jgi:hypothetical protein
VQNSSLSSTLGDVTLEEFRYTKIEPDPTDFHFSNGARLGLYRRGAPGTSRQVSSST